MIHFFRNPYLPNILQNKLLQLLTKVTSLFISPVTASTAMAC